MSVNLNREESTVGVQRIPKANYKLRILEEPEFKFTKEKADPKTGVMRSFPMLVFNVEIVEPSTRIVDGVEAELAGIELNIYAVIFPDKKNEGKEYCIALSAIHRQCELPMEFERDPDTGLPVNDSGVPLSYKGLEFMAVCASEEYVAKDDDGEPLKNPLTGEVQKGWNHKVVKIW